MNRAVSFKVVDDVFLLVYNENDLSDPEAKAIIDAFNSLDLKSTKVLVFTKGGAPTPAQRKQFNEVLSGNTLPVAVVSDARIVRGVVTALGWFNSGIKSFSPDQVEQAYQHLGIPSS